MKLVRKGKVKVLYAKQGAEQIFEKIHFLLVNIMGTGLDDIT